MTETMEYSAGWCRFRAWADFWVVSFPERIDTGVIDITDQNCIRKYSHFASRLYASGLGGLDIYAARYRPGQVIRRDGSTHEASDAPEAVKF
jgi:hypothetical protein